VNEEPIRHWRRVPDAALHQWAGGRLLAIGRAIANGGRVRDLVRTSAGEVFGTATDTEKARDYFAGVVMTVLGRKKQTHQFASLCSCERAPCLHAVAVAFALRASLWAGTGVAAQGEDRSAVR
jgi:uncharacterized Zn finger protein